MLFVYLCLLWSRRGHLHIQMCIMIRLILFSGGGYLAAVGFVAIFAFIVCCWNLHLNQIKCLSFLMIWHIHWIVVLCVAYNLKICCMILWCIWRCNFKLMGIVHTIRKLIRVILEGPQPLFSIKNVNPGTKDQRCQNGCPGIFQNSSYQTDLLCLINWCDLHAAKTL